MSYNYTTINSGANTLPIKASKGDLEKVQGSILRAFARKGGTGATYLYIVIPKHNLEKVAEVLQRSQTLSMKHLIERYVDPMLDTATIKIGFIPAVELVSVNPLRENVDYPVVFQDGKVTLVKNNNYTEEKRENNMLDNVINTNKQAAVELVSVNPLRENVDYPVVFQDGIVTTLVNTEEKRENNMLDNVINTNKQAAVQAGYLKAGRVANKALEGIVRKRFPTLPDTPFTGLVLANLVDVLGKQVKPSAELARVSGAMVTAAYLDMYDILDLEGIVEELLASVPTIAESDTIKAE